MMPQIVSGESSANVSAFETEDDAHRVLVVADEVFRGADLETELRSHLSDEPSRFEVFAIAPAIAHSAIDQELGNVDGPAREAADRLEAIIRELGEVGIEATGEVGDADPMVAIDDGLNEFVADEIIVVSHVGTESDYAERHLWTRLSTDYHQPVTQMLVSHPDADGSVAGVVSVEHAPAHEVTEDELIKETRNFPPLRRLDVAGILIGFIGTVALGMIAVAAGIDDAGEISGSAAMILLIAIAAFLLNVANIIGLLFFESVRYTGIWEKFFARTSIGFTTVGLAISLVLWLA
jgi:hypothetical protein